MRKTISYALAAVALSALLSCTTSKNPEMVSVEPPPPELSMPLPLEPKQKSPGFCQLGTSCMAMDDRPFEPCLLSTKHCTEKAAEPMLVAPPPSMIPVPQVDAF